VAINIQDENIPGEITSSDGTGSRRKSTENISVKPSSDAVMKSGNEPKSKIELMIIDHCPQWMTPRWIVFFTCFCVVFATILTILFKTLEITDHGKYVHF
jgi:hypothetical protein